MKEQSDSKGEEHPINIVCLDREWKENDTVILYPSSPSLIVKLLKSNLNELEAMNKNCLVCGSLLPELRFLYRGKTYDFTCTTITEKGQPLAITNYRTLEAYCHSVNEGKKE